MKKYIYIGQENGKEVVIETEMDKPKEHFIDGNREIQVRAAYRTEMANYSNHIANAPRIEAISPIPAYWKKGEEVQVTIQHKYFCISEGQELWADCTEEEYNYMKLSPNSKLKIVATPIDKAVEPEHIADTGKMIEESYFKLANDFDFYEALMDAEDGKPPLQRNSFQTIGDRVRLLKELEKRGFTITRKTKPNE